MPNELETFVKKVVTKQPVAEGIKRAALIDVELGGIVEEATFVNQDFITGLDIQWVGPSPSTTINVEQGAAFVPGTKQAIAVWPGGQKSLTPVTGTDHYYVYLFTDEAGVADIEISSVAPGSRYVGTARTKSTDAQKRYIGTLNQNPGVNSFRRFERENDLVLYTDGLAATEVLTAGSATFSTGVSLRDFIPPHIRLVWIIGTCFSTTASGQKVWVSSSLSGAVPPTSGQFFMEASTNSQLGNYSGWVKCDGVNELNYAVTNSTLQAWLWARGYIDPR